MSAVANSSNVEGSTIVLPIENCGDRQGIYDSDEAGSNAYKDMRLSELYCVMPSMHTLNWIINATHMPTTRIVL